MTIGLLILFTVIALLLLGFIFSIWMTVKVIQKKTWRSDDERIVWIALFAVGWFSGFVFLLAVIYYFAYYRVENLKLPSKK